MTADERVRRAVAVWRRIDGEIDAPPSETRKKASRLAYVARDLQAARGARAHIKSALLVVRYLLAVIARSWGMSGGLAV